MKYWVALTVAVGLFLALGQTSQESCTVYVLNASSYDTEVYIHSVEFDETQYVGVLESHLHMDITGPCTTQPMGLAVLSQDPNGPEQVFELSFLESDGDIHPHAFVVILNINRPTQRTNDKVLPNSGYSVDRRS